MNLSAAGCCRSNPTSRGCGGRVWRSGASIAAATISATAISSAAVGTRAVDGITHAVHRRMPAEVSKAEATAALRGTAAICSGRIAARPPPRSLPLRRRRQQQVEESRAQSDCDNGRDDIAHAWLMLRLQPFCSAKIEPFLPLGRPMEAVRSLNIQAEYGIFGRNGIFAA